MPVITVVLVSLVSPTENSFEIIAKNCEKMHGYVTQIIQLVINFDNKRPQHSQDVFFGYGGYFIKPALSQCSQFCGLICDTIKAVNDPCLDVFWQGWSRWCEDGVIFWYKRPRHLVRAPLGGTWRVAPVSAYFTSNQILPFDTTEQTPQPTDPGTPTNSSRGANTGWKATANSQSIQQTAGKYWFGLAIMPIREN